MARTLHFTLEITTELGNEDSQPAINYVTDWLNGQGYDFRLACPAYVETHAGGQADGG